MPTVLREKGFAFSFYGADGNEPPHVHVRKAGCEAKVWLTPFVRLDRNHGFRPHELTEIEKIILDHLDLLLETWNAFFPR